MRRLFNSMALLVLSFWALRGAVLLWVWIQSHNLGKVAWFVLIAVLLVGIIISDYVESQKRRSPPKKRRQKFIW